jgi:hypothetical protein
MKKIKLDGKLSLNKETIAKLNDEQMNGVKGGLLSISNHCSHCHGNCSCPGEPKNTKPLFCSAD